jgi:hypothetical protein
MLDVIFTLDYEIHGNGEGSPHLLMVEPTMRMMRSFERYGAKLTIMADVGEIGRFKEYAAVHGEDRFHAGLIEDQLREAVKCGHDVQLHVHSGYFGAVFENGRWLQDPVQRNLPGLGYERLVQIIGDGKSYLENLLRPVASDYACVAFRSAYWSMQPSRDIVRALRDQGIRIDTSVFKYGSKSGVARFDYSGAFSRLVPWPVDEGDVCLPDPQGELWEVPIYCENRRLWHFLSLMRLYQVRQTRIHPLTEGGGESGEGGAGGGGAADGRRGGTLRGLARKAAFLAGKHALKMDFNQCGGGQLIRTLKRIEKDYADFPYPLPVVLIGHSKLFTPYNEKSLRGFLEYVAKSTGICRFSTFRDLDPATMRKAFEHEYAGAALQRPSKNVQPGTAR